MTTEVSGAATSELYRSIDYGSSYSIVPTTVNPPTTYGWPVTWHAVSVAANGSWAVAAVYEGGLYRSSDRGATWSRVPGTYIKRPDGNYGPQWRGIACGKASPYCYAGMYVT